MIKIVGKDDKNNYRDFRVITNLLESFDDFPTTLIERDKVKNYYDLEGVKVLVTLGYDDSNPYGEEREICVISSGDSKKTREVVNLLRSFKA